MNCLQLNKTEREGKEGAWRGGGQSGSEERRRHAGALLMKENDAVGIFKDFPLGYGAFCWVLG